MERYILPYFFVCYFSQLVQSHLAWKTDTWMTHIYQRLLKALVKLDLTIIKFGRRIRTWIVENSFK